MVSFTSLQWFVKSVIKPVIVDIWLNIGILEKLTYHLLLFEISCCKLFVIHFIKFFGESFLLRYSGTNRPGTGFTTTNRRHSAFSHAVSTLPFKIFNLFSLLSLKEATLLKKYEPLYSLHCFPIFLTEIFESIMVECYDTQDLSNNFVYSYQLHDFIQSLICIIKCINFYDL